MAFSLAKYTQRPPSKHYIGDYCGGRESCLAWGCCSMFGIMSGIQSPSIYQWLYAHFFSNWIPAPIGGFLIAVDTLVLWWLGAR